MGTFVSPWLAVHSGEMRIMSPVVLAVATATATVTVTGNSVELNEELSEQQVQIAVGQRVLGQSSRISTAATTGTPHRWNQNRNSNWHFGP